ncbi:MAG: CPBP family intramembrane metalloprotease [Clostridiales bacterium]|nr:CPBP family intramembrane metalloprotease [Clostridiales bacterium]
MTKIKKALVFSLCLLPIAVVAGISSILYQIDTILTEEALAENIAQFGSTGALIVVYTVQIVCYAVVFGFIGYILADKTGLWKPIKFEKKKLSVALIVSAISGIIFSLDYWTFGRAIDGIQEGTEAGMTLNGIITKVLYGGVIEEVMSRLFLMTLIAFIIWKIFYRRCSKEDIPTGVFIAANILVALAFAAGHLPGTIMTFGGLTPLILFRCFLYNGGMGLVFGWFYRKYGIIYSMVSHAVCHIVSSLIWLLFIP